MKTWILAGLTGLFTAGAALAQSHGVPPAFLKNTRRMEGDRLSVCADVSGRTLAFDRRVAQLIADSLFLEMDFHEGFGGYPTSGDGFLDELQIALTNSCDLVVGMTVQENSPFPEWATLTRPYVSLPYMMMVKEDYQSLGDIPRDLKLGTALGSMGERVMITWNQQQPKSARFTRFPYADMPLMARRVLDGTIAGGLIWSPAWAELLANHPEAADLRAVPISPVPATVTRIGALVKTRDTFLRVQIDEAIDALVADGSIAGLMAEFNWPGTPGDDTRSR
ncbi:substrate-binding periplasmic protein [Falsigemmobacter faecalis]|uniref:Uncharacterized protein n=1 Tax=Falsigemmobacter faecalis TaxID=2488730 RepID=A0A3P3D9L9_9RHOB|nr:transporter substrate-binding domain-containing protein [Falsigemmobacter faecalis]RRH70306.1 hypothetical protein EG244_17100 [Falsigemmobacter faecalis]